MRWYKCTKRWGGRERTFIRQLTAQEAARRSATPVDDLEVAKRLGGLVVELAPDGDLEQGLPLTAEIPLGRR